MSTDTQAKSGATAPNEEPLTAAIVRREAIAGITTFFTMAYIVVVNPAILASPGTGMPFSGVLTATVLVCFTMTLLMGLYARLPFAVAPGMGINAFFAFSIIIGHKVPWPSALGIIFWAGVLFLVVSITPLREHVALAIPENLRTAAAAGIGVFLTFIGLKNAGLVVADPATLVRFGGLTGKSALSLCGIALIVPLMRRKSPIAFLAGVFSITAASWALGLSTMPTKIVAAPDFSSALFKLDIVGALKPSFLAAMVSILMTDLFDSISTFVGVSEACGLVNERGEPKNLREGLIVDALATLTAGLFGTSSGTAYIESAAGIEVGGRRGLTAIFTALCFLPCFFLSPLAEAVPAFATAPVLIVVGALMFRSVARLNLAQIEDALPAFLTVTLIPLTFSITQGLLWGFISHVALYVVVGRAREVRPAVYVLAAASIGLLLL